MVPMALSDAKYVRLTTFTRAGAAKASPVWIAHLGDGDVGFTTGSATWKVKRVRTTPKVLLQPSDARGNPVAGSAEVTGTARVATADELEQVRRAIHAKYRWQVTAAMAVGQIGKLLGKGPAGDTAIVVTPDPTPPVDS